MMRIITGKAKGVRLETLEGLETRPTAERVKEAVFSMLQFDIEGRRVLDLFSGSGQMALEALSRGASSAVLIDRSKNAIKIMEKNAIKTKLDDCCEIKNADALDYIKRNRGQKFDIVFLDPPYASGAYQPVLKALYEYEFLKPTSVIVCESDFDELLKGAPELERIYCVKRSSRYSKTVITLLEIVKE
ncbi:MAG: 16S rRNA (guanine(966)-N(2))-methyltransferase RsmD [Clostridia bacterium]|nr:16S rRNA (guanine(966)-N(2))-methyltransferase RsmD [Clostridia bacterium]